MENLKNSCKLHVKSNHLVSDKKSEASLNYLDNSREAQHINKKVCVCAYVCVHVYVILWTFKYSKNWTRNYAYYLF